MTTFLVFLVAYLFAADMAEAGPAVALITTVTTWLGTASVGAMLARTAIGIGLSALGRHMQKNKIQQPGITKDVTTQGEEVPLSMIFGRVATQGHHACPPMVYQTDDDPNEWMVYVLELSDIPITGYGRIWIDGEAHTFENDPRMGLDTDSYGSDVIGPFHRTCFVRLHMGHQTTADRYLVNTFLNYEDRPWDESMVLRGVAYAVITLKGRAADKYYTGGFPEIRMEIDGAALLDPRTNVVGFTENPMVIAWNIARGIQLPTGDVWGYDVPAADIVQGPAFAAMNACDEVMPNGDRRYRAGLEVTVDTEPSDAMQAFLDACSGDFADMGGEIVLTAGAPNPPVYAFNDSNIIRTSDEDFKPFEGLDAIKNAVHAKWPDPNKKWEVRDAIPLYNPIWEEQDGGRRLVVDMSFPAVHWGTQVRRLMREIAADGRRGRNHMITLPPDAGGVRLLDIVNWSVSAANGYVNKLFEVRQKSVHPWTGCVMLQLRERDPSDYNPNVFLDGVLPDVVPSVPVVPVPTGVQGWTVEPVDAGGVPGIRIGWNPDIVARAISWSITRVSNGLVVNRGTTSDISEGFMVLSAGLKRVTQYRVVGRRIMNRPTNDTVAVVVTTLDIGSIGREDIVADVLDDIERSLEEAARLDLIIAENRVILQNAIDAANAEVAEAQADLVTIRNDLLAEASAARAEAEALRTSVAGVVTQLNAGLATAQTNLNTARSELQTEIGNVQTGLRAEMGTAIQTGISTYDTTVQGRLDAMTGQINELTAALTSDNLFANGNFANGLDNWSFVSAGAFPREGSSTPLVQTSPELNVVRIGNGDVGQISQSVASFEMTADDRFQVRFAAAATLTRAVTVRVEFLDIVGNVLTTVDRNITISPVNQWRVYSEQFEGPQGARGAIVTILKTQTGAPLYATGFDASTVNVAIIAQISELRAAVTNLDAALTTYRTEVNTRFSDTNASVVTEANARSAADAGISSLVTALTTRTGAAEATIANQQTTLTSLSNSVAALDSRVGVSFGNRQLVQDSDFTENYLRWTGTTGSLVDRSYSSTDPILRNMPGRRAHRILNGAGGSSSRQSAYFDINPAGRYDLSAYVTREEGGPTIRVQIQQIDGAGTTILPHPIITVTPDVGVWTQVRLLDIVPNPGAVRARVLIQHAPTASTGSASSYVTMIEMIRQDVTDLRANADIRSLQTALASTDESFATYRTAIDTRFNTTNASVTQEATARSNADTAINGLITTLTGRVGTAETNISSEIVSRTNADSALGGRIDTLTTRVGTAETSITSANTARANADSALGQRIDTVTTRVGTAESTISTQQTSLTNLTNSLAAYRNEVTARFDTTDAAINSEGVARANADSAAATQINSVRTTAESRNRTYRQSTAPTGTLTTGDIWFDTSSNNVARRWSGSAWVLTEDTRVPQAVTDISSEITARSNADSALGTRIDTVTTRLGSAESAITTNNTARVNGDSALGSRIDTVTTRIGTAESTITTNNTARVNGDSALGSRVDGVSTRLGTAEGSIREQAATLVTQEASIADLSSYVTSTFGNVQLVRDPDFGDNFKFWPGGSSGALITRAKTSTSWVHSQMPGRRAVAIANAETGDRISVEFEVSTAERYDFGFYAGHETGGPRVRVWIQWRNEAGQQLARTNVDSSGSGAYRFYTSTNIQPPAGATKARVVITRLSDGTGSTSARAFITGIEVWRQTAYNVETDATIREQQTAITNASQAISALDTEVTASFGRINASGRFVVTNVANVNGSVSRIALSVATSNGGAAQGASIWMEARSDGQSYIVMDADRFVLSQSAGTGNRRIPFMIDTDGTVYMNNAVIKNLSVGTIKVANNAITSLEFSNTTTLTGAGSSAPTVQTLNMSKGRSDPLPIWYGAQFMSGGYTGPYNWMNCLLQLLRDGDVVDETTFEFSAADSSLSRRVVVPFVELWAGTGSVRYTMRARVGLFRRIIERTNSSSGPEYEERTILAGYGGVQRRFIGALNALK